tara:strand:- start:746 stop:1006 length:261 start_codon:yes stop_codon:yes gene_type:complete
MNYGVIKRMNSIDSSESTLIEKHDLNNIIKIRRIVKSTPNDMQLGKSIRSLIIDSTNVDSFHINVIDRSREEIININSTNDENDKE